MCIKTLTIDEFAMLDTPTLKQGLRLCETALALLRREKQKHPAPGSRDYDRVCAELAETLTLRKVFAGRLEELEEQEAQAPETGLGNIDVFTRHFL